MATLTTVDGATITFTPDSIAAVTDHGATGTAVTCVYGIAKAELRIAESVTAFLTPLGIIAKFVQLTRPDASPVWINGPSISSLSAPLPADYPPNVNTVVSAGAFTQGVIETPEVVIAAVNAHGGKL